MNKKIAFAAFCLLLSIVGCSNVSENSGTKSLSSEGDNIEANNLTEPDGGTLAIDTVFQSSDFNIEEFEFVTISSKMYLNQEVVDVVDFSFFISCAANTIQSMQGVDEAQAVDLDDLHSDYKSFISSICNETQEVEPAVVSCGSGCAMVYEIVEQRRVFGYEVNVLTPLKSDVEGQFETYRVFKDGKVLFGVYKQGIDRNIMDELEPALKEFLVNLDYSW